MSTFLEMPVPALAAAQATAALTGLKDAGGFLKWTDEAAAPPPASLTVVDETNNLAWFEHVNEQPAVVQALGCHQLFDVRLQRHGLIFHGETFASDASHLGLVALEETRAAGGALADTEVIASDKPGIIFVGPGVRIYGHWLVDFIPRLRIAQEVLGDDFDDYVLPLPVGTPAWALTMMRVLCGVSERHILWFDPETQSVDFRMALAPTYCHANYHMHPAAADFWPLAGRAAANRRLCISRLNYETRTDGVLKSFANRDLFESLAVEMGYELVYPEKLSLMDQISLFAGASHVVGEYGSALHNMLFAPAGAVVGAIRCPNDVQLRISALRSQSTVLLLPGKEWIDERGGQAYAVGPDSIRAFLKTMDEGSGARAKVA